MAKFEVHRLGEGILVVDCQADLLSDLETRFVVPLVLASESWGNVRRLNPMMPFSGAYHALLPKEAMSFDRRELGVPIGSLTEQRSGDRQCAGYDDLGVLIARRSPTQ